MYRRFFHLVFAVALVFGGMAASAALADEIVDDISVHVEAGGEVVAVLKFAYPIQYVRHFPEGRSAFTSIYFSILGNIPADVWQDYETHRTPPSDLIQEITVTT